MGHKTSSCYLDILLSLREISSTLGFSTWVYVIISSPNYSRSKNSTV